MSREVTKGSVLRSGVERRREREPKDNSSGIVPSQKKSMVSIPREGEEVAAATVI